jgi:hypothetical protein
MYKKKAKDLRAVIAAKQQSPTLPHNSTTTPVVSATRLPKQSVECTEEYFAELRKRHANTRKENVRLRHKVQAMEIESKEMRRVLDEAQFQSRSGVRLLLEAVKKKKSPLEKQIIHHTEKLQMLKEEQDTAFLQIEALIIVIQRLQEMLDCARTRGKFQSFVDC